MATSTKSSEVILRRAEETLRTAGLGLADLLGGQPDRRLAGLSNLVVFGRAVTNVLQNLRSTEPCFDEWYAPYVKQMETDPLLRFFYELRSRILKKGDLAVRVTTYIRRLEIPSDLQRFGPPPPNACGFFIGDQYGGSGWEIELQDGSKAKYYVELPGDLGATWIDFQGAPMEHLGRKLEVERIESLSKLYFEYLETLVRAAIAWFDSSRASAGGASRQAAL